MFYLFIPEFCRSFLQLFECFYMSLPFETNRSNFIDLIINLLGRIDVLVAYCLLLPCCKPNDIQLDRFNTFSTKILSHKIELVFTLYEGFIVCLHTNAFTEEHKIGKHVILHLSFPLLAHHLPK